MVYRYFKEKKLLLLSIFLTGFFVINMVQAENTEPTGVEPTNTPTIIEPTVEPTEIVEPGSELDPIVSQSYVDMKINEVITNIELINSYINELPQKSYIDENFVNLENKINENTFVINSKIDETEQAVEENSNKIEYLENRPYRYEIIEAIEPEKQVIFGQGAEFILRAGGATAIASENGGLADLSSGIVGGLMTGDEVPLNHLIICSRDDGRGINITKESWVLVKGPYFIKDLSQPDEPIIVPSIAPGPTPVPTVQEQPTETPTPTDNPIGVPINTPKPTIETTDQPVPTQEPTGSTTPTQEPTNNPTPTQEPTSNPSPTQEPTPEPTVQPSP